MRVGFTSFSRKLQAKKTSFFLRKEAKKLNCTKKPMPHYPPSRSERFKTGAIITLVAMSIFALIKGIEYLICLYL